MLIIALPLSPQAEPTYVVSVDGLSVQSSGQCAPDRLPRVGGEVVAVVPWQRLSWHQVEVPTVSAARRLAVLQGLLEDQVLQEADSLHWVLPDTFTQGQTCVLACDKRWLRAALAPLAEAGWVVQRIVPELSPSEATSAALYGVGSPDFPQVLGCLPEAVVGFPAAAWPGFVATMKPGIRVMAEPALVAFMRELTGQEPVLQTAPQRWLQACQSPWDLAQGEWAQNRHRRTWRSGLQAWQQLIHAPAWRPARWALGITLAAQLLGLQMWALQTRQHHAQLADTSQDILRQSFPAVQVVVDPLRQMNQAVQQLRQQSGAASPTDLDMLLAQLAPLLPSGTVPQALRYDGKTLTVQGLPLDNPSPQALEQLRRNGYQWRPQGSDWLLGGEARP
jgi:general secretion pathway protein L